MSRVRLLVLNAALGPLDYRVPHGMAVEPGSVVLAPLGPRQVLGVVWDEGRLPGETVGDNRLRPLLSVLPVPPLGRPLRRLIEWTADYYCAPLAAVARMALSSQAALTGGRTMTEYRLADAPPAAPEPPPPPPAAPANPPPTQAMAPPPHEAQATAPPPAAQTTTPPPLRPATRMTPQRAQAMARLSTAQGTIRELAAIAGVSEAVVRGMANAGLLAPVSVDIDRPWPRADPDHATPLLGAEQAAAAARLVAAVRQAATHSAQPEATTDPAQGGAATDASGPHVATGAARPGAGPHAPAPPPAKPFLLDGVTGSGKTETYFEAVAEAIRLGRQVLVLLPEIALTANFLHRFARRFGVAPVLWHSALKASERRRAWRAVTQTPANGGAQVVVGARSALFLPFAALGLIVVDEAHETSFKQDDGVRYNGRDVAVMRAKFEAVPVILASATPALESMALAEAGVYERLVLPVRFGGATMPKIEIIDLTRDPPERGKWLAPPLVAGLRLRLARGEQSLLFLNRRGYAPLTLCRHCGYRFKCAQCSAWLVEHRLSRRLACHHCGHEEPVPDTCPECHEADCLVACGPGVERIADEVAALLPEARIALVTSDTLTSPDKVAAFVAQTEAGEIDVIVGTQLVTKGYHFPALTLVGVVDADLGLEGGDLRAGERSYQQIAQVAGRAGRGARAGEVMLQTRHPTAPVIQAMAAGDRDAFYAAETAARRSVGAPPFGRWAAVIVSSEDEAEARDAARAIGGTRPTLPDVAVLGPAPAPLSLLRGRYRYRLLINARRSAALQEVIRAWLGGLAFPPGVRVGVDIDPYSFV